MFNQKKISVLIDENFFEKICQRTGAKPVAIIDFILKKLSVEYNTHITNIKLIDVWSFKGPRINPNINYIKDISYVSIEFQGCDLYLPSAGLKKEDGKPQEENSVDSMLITRAIEIDLKGIVDCIVLIAGDKHYIRIPNFIKTQVVLARINLRTIDSFVSSELTERFSPNVINLFDDIEKFKYAFNRETKISTILNIDRRCGWISTQGICLNYNTNKKVEMDNLFFHPDGCMDKCFDKLSNNDIVAFNVTYSYNKNINDYEFIASNVRQSKSYNS